MITVLNLRPGNHHVCEIATSDVGVPLNPVVLHDMHTQPYDVIDTHLEEIASFAAIQFVGPMGGTRVTSKTRQKI